jgi:hypothetical protein
MTLDNYFMFRGTEYHAKGEVFHNGIVHLHEIDGAEINESNWDGFNYILVDAAKDALLKEFNQQD